MVSLFDQAFAPFSMDRKPVNVLSQVLGGGFNGGPDAVNNMPVMQADPLINPPQVPTARAPRDRRSVLDIIGGIADTVATVGGATPLYQPTLDAREDRTHQMELDEIRKRISEQTMQAGDAELEGIGREQLADVLAGVVGSENPAATFAALAQTANLPPERVAQIQQALEAGVDPDRLARSMGYQPASRGSPSAIEAEYALRYQALGPEAADEWLQTEGQKAPPAPKRSTYTINAGDRIEEYDIESGSLVRSIPVGARPTATSAQGEASLEGLANAFRTNRSAINDMKDAIEDMASAGSINAPGQSAAGRVGTSVYRNLPFVEQVLNEEGFDARERLQSSALTAITALEPLIQQATGAGVKLTSKMMDTPKELEVRLQTIMNAKSKNAAITAWQRFKDRYDEAERELQQQIKAAGPSAVPAGGNSALEAALRERERRRNQGR